jgi:protein-tyrosine phosphatase
MTPPDSADLETRFFSADGEVFAAALSEILTNGDDSLVPLLREGIRRFPERGAALGPAIAKLLKAGKDRAAAAVNVVNWLSLGAGSLAIGHRPSKGLLQTLKLQGMTHLVTLLGEKEGAREIGRWLRPMEVKWIWLSMLSGGGIPEAEQLPALRAGVRAVAEAIRAGGRVYIHCSAGIHRTGMIAYAVMLDLQLPPHAARANLDFLRKETAAGVGGERLAWVEAAFLKREPK